MCACGRQTGAVFPSSAYCTLLSMSSLRAVNELRERRGGGGGGWWLAGRQVGGLAGRQMGIPERIDVGLEVRS